MMCLDCDALGGDIYCARCKAAAGYAAAVRFGLPGGARSRSAVPERNQQKYQVGDALFCTTCRAKVPDDAAFCPYCGTWLDADNDPWNPATDMGGQDDGQPKLHLNPAPVTVNGITMTPASSSIDARGFDAWRERQKYLESLDSSRDRQPGVRRSWLDTEAEERAVEYAAEDLQDARSAVSIARANLPEFDAGLRADQMSPDARHRAWLYQQACLEEQERERAYDAAKRKLDQRTARLNAVEDDARAAGRMANTPRDGAALPELHDDDGEDLAVYSDDPAVRAAQQRADDRAASLLWQQRTRQ